MTHLEGDDGTALARYREVIARYPDDKAVRYLAGDLLWLQGDYGGAVPHLDRAVELDPSFESALKELVWCLGSLRRHDDLRERLQRWSRLPSTPALRSGAVRALFWLGDLDQALAAARGNAARAESPWPAVADAVVQFQTGDFAGAEATLGDAARAFPERSGQVRIYQLWTIAAQGRVGEAMAALGEATRTNREASWQEHLGRARLLVARGDFRSAWIEVRELARANPAMAAVVATDLAVLGDTTHALELIPGLPPRSPDRELLEATLAWRTGDVLGAKARLRALEAITPILPQGDSIPPGYALAEIAAATGEDGEVIEAVSVLRPLWNHMASHGSWMVPRASFLLARSPRSDRRGAPGTRRAPRAVDARRWRPAAPRRGEGAALELGQLENA